MGSAPPLTGAPFDASIPSVASSAKAVSDLRPCVRADKATVIAGAKANLVRPGNEDIPACDDPGDDTAFIGQRMIQSRAAQNAMRLSSRRVALCRSPPSAALASRCDPQCDTDFAGQEQLSWGACSAQGRGAAEAKGPNRPQAPAPFDGFSDTQNWKQSIPLAKETITTLCVTTQGSRSDHLLSGNIRLIPSHEPPRQRKQAQDCSAMCTSRPMTSRETES